jgi:hypothetical protein
MKQTNKRSDESNAESEAKYVHVRITATNLAIRLPTATTRAFVRVHVLRCVRQQLINS